MLKFVTDLLVSRHTPSLSHLSKGILSIPTAGVAQRNRCRQNLLATCVLVARRPQFCNDVIEGYFIARRCRAVGSFSKRRAQKRQAG